MANEFIIKINKDKNGNELSLENMPLDAVDAITVFLTSLKDFGSLHNNQDIKFSLKNGCIETAILYPETDEEVGNDINNILDGSSENNEFIRLFKIIQDKVLLDELDCSILHKVNNNPPVDVTEIFRAKKFAYRRQTKKIWRQEIVFIDGLLVDNGGKTITNLHIETGNEEIVIVTTREEAKIVRNFLFDNVYVVAVKRYHVGEKAHYKYIDSYITPELYKYYKDFYSKIHSDETLKKYDIIYDTIVEILNSERSIGEVLKIMRLFNFNFCDRGIIRTILMALKPIDKSNNQKLREMYESLSQKLRETSTNNII